MSNHSDITISGLDGANGINASSIPNAIPSVSPNGADGYNKGLFGWGKYVPAENGLPGVSVTTNADSGTNGVDGNDAGIFSLNITTFNISNQITILSVGGNGGNGGVGGNGGNGGAGGNAGKNKSSYGGTPAKGGMGGNGSGAGNGGSAGTGGNGGFILVAYTNAEMAEPVRASSAGGTSGSAAGAGTPGMGGAGGRDEDGNLRNFGIDGSVAKGGNPASGGSGSNDIVISKK